MDQDHPGVVCLVMGPYVGLPYTVISTRSAADTPLRRGQGSSSIGTHRRGFTGDQNCLGSGEHESTGKTLWGDLSFDSRPIIWE
jgi:hypothetical protein